MSTCRYATPSPECGTMHLSVQQHQHNAQSPTLASNQEQRACSRESVLRWSSVERGGSTPSERLQIQPAEVVHTSRDGDKIVCNEHSHKMLLDGDAYTLVILDCSPQCACGSGTTDCDCSRLGTNIDRACDCQSRCHCQTELIVKQHSHNCQQHDSQPQQQQRQQELQRLAIEHPSSSSSANQRQLYQTVESSISHTGIEQNRQEQKLQQQQYEGSQRRTVTTNQYQQQYLQPQQQQPQYQYQQQQPQRSPQQMNQNQDFNGNYQQQFHSQTMSTQYQGQQTGQSQQPQQYPQQRYEEREQYQQPSVSRHYQQTQTSRQERPVDSSTKDTEQSTSKVGRQPKSGTRLVKRWDWNQAQFVTAEVPEQTVKPQIAPMSPHHTPSTDVWHQDTVISPSRASNISSAAGPSSSSLSINQPQQQQQQQLQDSQQPWLAHRIPDLESVQSDPLYRDIMLELQRLEEGVSAPEPPQVIQPETSQPPVFGQTITPESVEVKEYENVEFVCRLIPISDPSMRVEWTLNGRPLLDSNRYTIEHEFGVARLHIKRCEAEDSGVYQCKASNSLGEAYSTATLRVHAKGNIQCETLHPAGLDKIRELENPKPVDRVEEPLIEQPPKFLTHISDYVEKEEGESVHFECCLGPVDDPDLKTEWFFNGRPLVTGSRFHTIDDFGFIVLDIDWLFPRDTGEYVCRASNRYGSDITRTVLRVKPDKNIVLDSQLDNGPMVIDKLRQLEFPDVAQEMFVEEPDKPAHFVQHLKSEGNKRQFVEGDNVHFEARVGPATDGNLIVEWFHNDKPLISGHRFKPTFDFGHIQLDILYVYAEDSGIYKCVARNAAGTDVSQFEINVTGKPSLVYQSQLPKEMEGGVKKITDMEAMWNRAPDPEEEAPPIEKMAPEFSLRPKACTAFENSCARFCCRIVGHPKSRVTWFINGQPVVSGSRYKLTYDGMYHLIIPKCMLTDAGKVEVRARNLLGECHASTELKVKRKVDDYRGVLKNSPNPWYDETSLKVYQRHRSSQDIDEDDEDMERYLASYQASQVGGSGLKPLQLAGIQQSSSPIANQVIGYMEPGTPDVNLLARIYSPLVEPGDLHPVVAEQQAIMAPAPSTIQRALKVKDKIKTPEKSFQLSDSTQQRQARQQLQKAGQTSPDPAQQDLSQQGQREQHRVDMQHVFGLDLPRYSASSSRQADRDEGKLRGDPQQQRQQQQQRDQHLSYQNRMRQHQDQNSQQQKQQQQQLQQQQQQQLRLASEERQLFDPRLPPPSPESMVHGKEVHSHTHKQTQLERRANKEIIREIIEKEIFEQEHKGVTKDNVVRGSSVERGSTPTDSVLSQQEEWRKQQQLQMYQQQQLYQQRQQQYQQREQARLQRDQQIKGRRQEDAEREQQQQQQRMAVHFQEQVEIVDENMVPPEFIQKIQPCQAIDGDEARFECTFKGEPKPKITWFRESKVIKPSNLYTIITDLNEDKSTLIIKRVSLNGGAMYSVKAENAAGSAKSSANLVIEPHPLPESGKAGVARQIDSSSYAANLSSQQHVMGNKSDTSYSASSTGGQTTFTTTTSSSSRADFSGMGTSGEQVAGGDDSSQSDSLSQKVVKSVKTRKLRSDEMAALIRASPEGLIAPTFLHTIHDTTGKPGELARLDARLVGTQPMEVRWLKDGQRIRADRSHKMVLEGDLYTLLILECSQRDEGSYECIATNRVGEARCEAKLIVSDGRQSVTGTRTPEIITTNYSSSASASTGGYQSATMAATSTMGLGQQQTGQQRVFGVQRHQPQNTPSPTPSLQELPKLIKRLENQQVREGKSVTLRCQISSFPTAEVHWYRQDDKLIKPSKYFRIFKDNDETYCLRILETFPEDQGEYKCVARSPSGHNHVETKAFITVIPNSPK